MSKELESVASLISEEFLQQVFQKYRNDTGLRIKSVSLTNATQKGDNYTSDLYRVNVTFASGESTSVILKVAPYDDGVRKELVDQSKMFPTEIKMMTDTLVKMNKMLRSLNEGAMSADVLFARLESPSILILEDLKSQGFQMADRCTGLDLSHSKLALVGLAKFHATSILYMENEPLEANNNYYQNRMFCSANADIIGHLVKKEMKALAEEMKNWPELDASYSEKILKLSDNAFERCKSTVIRDDEEFNVLNHGDFWTNNMMFRYDEDHKPVDFKFVDFQLCCHTSPALDLTDFFSFSVTEEIYHNQRDYLLNVYHESLIHFMNQLKCKTNVPTMQQLKASLKKYLLYELTAIIAFKPLVMTDRKYAKDIKEWFEGDEVGSINSLRNPNFRKAIVNRLPNFENTGIFD